MGLEEVFQPVRDQADVGSVAIVVVHHDPLPVAQLGYVVADPLERRIEISDETGQHTEARTGADEIAQGPRPVDGCDNPLSGILARPSEIGWNRIFIVHRNPRLRADPLPVARPIGGIGDLSHRYGCQIGLLRLKGTQSDVIFPMRKS